MIKNADKNILLNLKTLTVFPLYNRRMVRQKNKNRNLLFIKVSEMVKSLHNYRNLISKAIQDFEEIENDSFPDINFTEI